MNWLNFERERQKEIGDASLSLTADGLFNVNFAPGSLKVISLGSNGISTRGVSVSVTNGTIAVENSNSGHRAVLGAVKLDDIRTGEKIERPASSLTYHAGESEQPDATGV